MFTFTLFYHLMTLQQQLPTGKNGDTGPIAQPLVARGPKSGLELVVNHLLEVMGSVRGNPRRLTIAKYQSAKVDESFVFSPLCNADYCILQLYLPNGKNGASGPNAVSPVAKDLNSECGHAVERSLEAMKTVLDILQRLGSVT